MGFDQEIVRPLLKWFSQNARILPWREQPEPYRVWVSEIMLQQTRVEAVKPFFQRFLAALPEIKALAECDQEQLLKLWEGLGYYNRVRNMQKAAIQIQEEYDGRLPADYEKLLKLPGIGPYTAGAIGSIAYGLPVPAVDGNVMRVVSRVDGSFADITEAKVKKDIEEIIQHVIPSDAPGDFNQAMMEIGATVCVPNGAPHCEQCPLKTQCIAAQKGLTDQIPVKRKKSARRVEDHCVLVIRNGSRTAIRKRPEKGLLAGLYELPSLEGTPKQEEVLKWIEQMGYLPLQIEPLPVAKHIFSHVEWHMTGYAVRIAETEEREGEQELLFLEPWETEERYPIPAAFSYYSAYLSIRLGQEKYESAGQQHGNGVPV